MATTMMGSPKNNPRLPNLGQRWNAANDRGEPRYMIPCSVRVSLNSPREDFATRAVPNKSFRRRKRHLHCEQLGDGLSSSPAARRKRKGILYFASASLSFRFYPGPGILPQRSISMVKEPARKSHAAVPLSTGGSDGVDNDSVGSSSRLNSCSSVCQVSSTVAIFRVPLQVASYSRLI